MCKEIAVLFGRPWSVSGAAAATSWPWRRRSGELRFEERFGSLRGGPGRQDEPGGAPGRLKKRGATITACSKDATRLELRGDEGGRPTAGTNAGTEREGRLIGACRPRRETPRQVPGSAAGGAPGTGAAGLPTAVFHTTSRARDSSALPPVAPVAGEAAVCDNYSAYSLVPAAVGSLRM